MKHIIMILTAPSCSGKSTLESKLSESKLFEKTISVTSRTPRPGEKDGVDYYFLEKSEIQAMHQDNKLVEMVEFNGNCYGVTRDEIQRHIDLGKHSIVVCEPHGAYQYREFALDNGMLPINLFLNAPLDLCAERFYERLKSEKWESGASTNQGIITSYASRFSLMMTEEQGWRYQMTYDLESPVMDGSEHSQLFEQMLSDIGKGRIPEDLKHPERVEFNVNPFKQTNEKLSQLKATLERSLEYFLLNDIDREKVGKSIMKHFEDKINFKEYKGQQLCI